MKTRRISIFGGPGSGKSTLAARVFANLKMRGYSVEQVTEYVKQMAYEGRAPQSYDELYIFSKQLHREDLALRHVPLIITDCPPLMCAAYARALKFPCWEALLNIALQWEKDYPSLNFFIERTVPYKAEGRFQTEKQANVVASDILSMLEAHAASRVDFKVIRFAGPDGIGHNGGLEVLVADGSIPTYSILVNYIESHLTAT